MAAPTRFNDSRYKKWKALGQRQDTWLEEIQRNIDERPKSRYEVDEIVLCPKLGIRGISGKYYNGSKWWYTFSTRDGLYKFEDKQLMGHGELLLMKDVANTIRAGG